MNLSQHPNLLDQLASAYALGTLRGGARRRFESLAREQAPVRAAALIWQSRVASMNELQASTRPAEAVWTRIANLVRADTEQQRMAAARLQAAPSAGTGWLKSLALWRITTAAGALATALAVVAAVGLRDEIGSQVQQVNALQAKLAAQPEVTYVAVLQDQQDSASMLVTFDPKSKQLTLQRVGGFQEASDKSLQLWALPPSGGPRSLGVLSREKLLRLTAGEADVREVPTLAISLEPQGGVPSETGPTGPVLFKGALIHKML